MGARANNNGAPNRRLSLNASQNGSRSTAKGGRRETIDRPAAPTNYVAISKEEAAASSPVSGAAGHVSASP